MPASSCALTSSRLDLAHALPEELPAYADVRVHSQPSRPAEARPGYGDRPDRARLSGGAGKELVPAGNPAADQRAGRARPSGISRSSRAAFGTIVAVAL